MATLLQLMKWQGPDALAVGRGLPVGFLLLRYLVVESFSLLYLLLYIDLYVLGDDALKH